MMNNLTSSAWMWGFSLHWLFGTALLVGIILFVVWAVRHLDRKSLQTWVIWLLVVGTLGTVLTSGWGWTGWKNMHGNFKGGMMEQGGMMRGNMMNQR